MDNRTIDIVAEGNDALALAIQLVWANYPERKATHYRVMKMTSATRYHGHPTPDWHETRLVEDPEGVATLVLLWHEEKDALPLPYPLAGNDAITFIQGWLRHADYPADPGDDDISTSKAWRVFADKWGKVAGQNYAIIGVQPQWAMYGR